MNISNQRRERKEINIEDFLTCLDKHSNRTFLIEEAIDEWCNFFKISGLDKKHLARHWEDNLDFYYGLYINFLSEIETSFYQYINREYPDIDKIINNKNLSAIFQKKIPKYLELISSTYTTRKDGRLSFFFLKELLYEYDSKKYLEKLTVDILNRTHSYIRNPGIPGFLSLQKESKYFSATFGQELKAVGRLLEKGFLGQNSGDDRLQESACKITEEKFKIIAKETMNNKEILFFLVGIGIASCIGYFWTSRKKLSEVNSLKKESKKRRDFDLMPLQSNILLLFLSSSDQDFISDLRTIQGAKKIPSAIIKRLYKLTDFIWLGTPSEYDSYKFHNYFKSHDLGRDNEKRDSDIYCLKIHLEKSHSGFEEKNSLDRLEAFKSLSEYGKIVAISERLSNDAYKCADIYPYRN